MKKRTQAVEYTEVNKLSEALAEIRLWAEKVTALLIGLFFGLLFFFPEKHI